MSQNDPIGPSTGSQPRQRVVAWWSGGITSAVACALALKWNADVDLLFIDIEDQHQDTYRFKADCERWYGRGINTVRSDKYSSVGDVIEKDRYINGPNGARCSMVLKRWVREAVQDRTHYDAHVFGFEFAVKEIARAVRFQFDHGNINPRFPLINESRLNKDQCAGIVLTQGIELPLMYRLGYNNNNCVACVKGGEAYFNKVRVDFPEAFAMRAAQERAIGHSCINGTFLDELDPSAGRGTPPVAPECGPFCGMDDEGLGLFTDTAQSIFSGQLAMI